MAVLEFKSVLAYKPDSRVMLAQPSFGLAYFSRSSQTEGSSFIVMCM